MAAFFTAAIFSVGAFSANDQIVHIGKVTVLKIDQGAGVIGSIDYLSAKPIPLPLAIAQPSSLLDTLLQGQGGVPGLSTPSSGGTGASGNASVPSFSQGGFGNGKLSPVVLVRPYDLSHGVPWGQIVPEDYGSSNQPFTTSRSNALNNGTTRFYPFRAAGKLWFNEGASTYVCSASLIKPGIVVTAAHCVANFGKSQWWSNWQFAPGYDQGVAPYGIATAKAVYLLTAYFNGTDSCFQKGVICQNDVAVIVLNAKLGINTGWLGYGMNGYGYVNNTNQLTQLGYPVSLDNGTWQERTDSLGYVSSSFSNNTLLGSGQAGGASGGPWIVNFGIEPVGENTGGASGYNAVVGVTSWGYTSAVNKQMGASPFTSSNIGSLVSTACANNPGNC